MGPPSFMLSVVDRNVVMRRITVHTCMHAHALSLSLSLSLTQSYAGTLVFHPTTVSI